MALKKLDLLTLLISLFILTGCENPSGIGLAIDPQSALDSDTITLNVETKLLEEDTIATNFTNRSVLAHIKDNSFGTTVTNMVLAVTLPTSNVSFGINPQLDSAVLVLPYTANALYGDSAIYKAQVRQLDEWMYTENPQRVYFSNKVWSKTTTVRGEKFFRPNYSDSTRIGVYGKIDSFIKVIPQLRIPLDNSFIKQSIVDLDSAELSTNLKFANEFKGLHVSLDQTVTSANGGAIAFNTNTAGSARVEIYYRSENAEGKKDTLVKSLPISGSAGAAATEIKWTKSAEVQNELDNTTNNNAKLFFKGLAGTKVKVSFPKSELAKLKDPARFKNLAINRAELIFTAEEPTQASLLPLELLRIYKWDLANQPKPVPDEDQADPRYMGPNFVGGSYNKTKKIYTINLTGYIQDLVKGVEEYGTFISTYDFLNKTERLSYPGNVISEGGASTSPNKVKLKIYYTDLK